MIFAPPLTAALMWASWSTTVVRELENVTIDWRYNARAESDPAPDPRIALIGIGNFSLENIGRWQDWSRSVHGKFLEALTYRPPKVVAFDLFFPENSKEEEEDFIFADALSVHPGAITGMHVDTSLEAREKQESGFEFPPVSLYATKPFSNVIGDRTKILSGPTASTPIEVIAQSSWTGSVNFPPSKIDGMRRKIPLISRVGDDIFSSLVLQILIQNEEAKSEEVIINLGKSITVPRRDGGTWEIPIDDAGFHYVNYRDTNRFQIIDYYSTFVQIHRTEEGAPWPDDLPTLVDQILIVGQSAEGLSDFGPTPYRAEDPLFAVQATVLDSILRQDFVKQCPVPVVILTWLAIAWLTLFFLRKAPISIAMAAPILVVTGASFLAFYLFETHSLIVPLVLPVLGFLAINSTILGDRLFAELQEKKRIRSMFGSYVSPMVVDQLIESGEMPRLGGHETEITMFFSDIQGFSNFSEILSPERLVVLMNDYLSEMTEILTGGTGTLDKYIGDAIVGMFGAPLRSDTHAHAAVVASIAIQNRQTALREKWKESGEWPEVVHHMRTRIGLNSGPAVIGNMGSAKQFNYTMMGDNVNLAARCESGAKSYGVFTMITGDTHAAAKAANDNVAYRFLDKIIVKGRTQPADVYEVVEFKKVLTDQQKECLEMFAVGVELYLKQDWDEAILIFEKSSQLETWQPEKHVGVYTNPSLVLLERCRSLKIDPPGEDWDGVYRMMTK